MTHTPNIDAAALAQARDRLMRVSLGAPLSLPGVRDDLRLVLDAADRAQASEAIESALQESRDGWVKLYTDANAERDALKAEVEAERNEARGYREQFKTAVGHYTTLRARLGLDGFATVEEVLRKVDTLRSKLSASEAEVERLREALKACLDTAIHAESYMREDVSFKAEKRIAAGINDARAVLARRKALAEQAKESPRG